MEPVDFVNRYFISPIQYEQGYNYINTITYALLAFAFLFLLARFFRKTETKIDIKFLLSLLPFIVLGSFIRVLVDSGQLQRSFWTVSPGIYFSVAFLFFTSFIIAFYLEKFTEIQSLKTTAFFGLVLLLSLVVYSLPIKMTNLGATAIILTTFSLITVLSYFILKKLSWSWATNPLSFTALSAQLFDATTTSFLVQFFGAVEKHPLPRFVIDTFGSGFVFFPLKIIVILFAVYVITKEVEDRYLRNTLIISIIILGLAQGLRNILSFVFVT